MMLWICEGLFGSFTSENVEANGDWVSTGKYINVHVEAFLDF